MKKRITTLMVAAIVILFTASFGYAEYVAGGPGSFPYFQLGCLIIGGMMIVSLKQKYEKMYTTEAVGAFALYAVLMALFTNPVIDLIKNMVG